MPQYGCGDRMPQQMSGTSAGTHHPSATQYPHNNRRDGRIAGEGTKGGSAAHKNCVGLRLRSAIFEVIDNRLTHFLGQWQSCVRAALTTNDCHCPKKWVRRLSITSKIADLRRRPTQFLCAAEPPFVPSPAILPSRRLL